MSRTPLASSGRRAVGCLAGSQPSSPCRSALETRRASLFRASYANFVWGVAAEPWPAYPSLGISTRPGTGGLEIIHAEKASPAAAAGVKTGDVLKSFDGVAVTGSGQLSELMAGKTWSDEALVVVRRGKRDETIRIAFVRAPLP
jgi:predicted metalloprotease with PDZ domain